MQVMIRCKVRPDRVEADLKLLQEVYEEMRAVQPKGLRYVAFHHRAWDTRAVSDQDLLSLRLLPGTP